jgi:hypothetical protein
MPEDRPGESFCERTSSPTTVRSDTPSSETGSKPTLKLEGYSLETLSNVLDS